MDADLAAALAMSMAPAGDTDTAPAAAAASASSEPNYLSPALQNLIQSIQAGQKGSSLELQEVLKADALSEILRNDTTLQDMLMPDMPDGLQTKEELFTFIRSPQFRQTVAELGQALSTENMYQILLQMGIDPGIAPGPGARGFLQALITALSKKALEQKPAQDDDDDLDADLYD